MKLETTLQARPAPALLPPSWYASVCGWLHMLLAEILCFSSGFKAK